MKKNLLLVTSILALNFACSTSSPVSKQAKVVPAVSERLPASMDWEINLAKEDMDESTAKWYQNKINASLATSSAAHVDIANKIAQAKLNGGTCAGFYYSDLVDHYLYAIYGNPKAKFDSAVHKLLNQNMIYRVVNKMIKNSDDLILNYYSLNSGYYLSHMTMEDFDNVYFETLAAGAYGSWSNFVLSKNGKVKFNNLVMDEDGNTSWETHEGSWKLKYYDPKENKTDKNEYSWERRGLVIYLTQIKNGKEHTKAYRVRFKNNEYRLESKAQDFSKEDFSMPTYISGVSGECDA